MTRKTALYKAIEQLKTNEGNEEIIQKLKDLVSELPIIHWTDKSIRDRVEQFIEENGRNPTASDFRKKGMPPHPVIRQKYKINLAEWLKENYPTIRPTAEEITKQYVEEFKTEYYRIKPKSSDEYDVKRTKGVKSWQTVRSRCKQKSWRGLLKYLKLEMYYPLNKDRAPMEFDVSVNTDVDFDVLY